VFSKVVVINEKSLNRTSTNGWENNENGSSMLIKKKKKSYSPTRLHGVTTQKNTT
jgi:hypothetical protein